MKLRILVLFLIVLSLSSCVPLECEPEVSYVQEVLYKCESRNLIQSCSDGLSSTNKTCYELNDEGERVGIRCLDTLWQKVINDEFEDTPQAECGNYRCYPEKGYCRLEGLLTNPIVPIDEVC